MILISPVLLACGLLVWARLGRPVFFRHVRAGYRGQPFTLLKFRTMAEARDAQGRLKPDADRLTPLGTTLRSFSLDELPELINVLRGEMSLVGPRPLLVDYLPRYSSEQSRRHEVLPGMTGWAQVNGRNVLEWKEKFKLDVWYVDHWSVWLDVRILATTLWKAVTREGINQEGYATAPEFKGDE
jgi:lipopolysaccharide/colanic/teichoic acid biosynthesis glycosyltransferase